MDRRNFLTTLTAGAALAAAAPAAMAKMPKKSRPEGFIWADLLHFGMNMWGDWDRTSDMAPEDQFKKKEKKKSTGGSKPQDHLRFDYETWRDLTAHMARAFAKAPAYGDYSGLNKLRRADRTADRIS